MSTALLLSLVGLALLDSTSIGTFFIPVWFLLVPGRIRVGRMATYLATIAAFYFGVGVLIVLGIGAIATALQGARDSPVLLWAELVVGAGLLVFSFSPRFSPKRTRHSSGSRRTVRWRERAMSESSAVWLVGLALLAGLAEVVTMLPYLAAIGILTTSDLTGASVALLLGGYCVMMVLPAGLLTIARAAGAARVEPLLHRMDHWINTKGASAMGWVIGIAGFLLARDAAAQIWFSEFMH